MIRVRVVTVEAVISVSISSSSRDSGQIVDIYTKWKWKEVEKRWWLEIDRWLACIDVPDAKHNNPEHYKNKNKKQKWGDY